MAVIVAGKADKTEVRCWCGQNICPGKIEIERRANGNFTATLQDINGTTAVLVINERGLRELRNDLSALLGENSDRSGG